MSGIMPYQISTINFKCNPYMQNTHHTKYLKIPQTWVSEWVEFNAPLDTI